MRDLSPRDRADRAYAEIMRRLPHGAATKLAKEMGISDKEFSALKNEHTSQVLLMLALLGLKCVPSQFHCLTPTDYHYLTGLEARISRTAPQLKWEDSDLGPLTTPGEL